MKRPCPYCKNLIPDSGIWGLPTYTDVPENHKLNCPIREIMEVSIANAASQRGQSIQPDGVGENCYFRGGHGCGNIRLDVPWKSSSKSKVSVKVGH